MNRHSPDSRPTGHHVPSQRGAAQRNSIATTSVGVRDLAHAVADLPAGGAQLKRDAIEIDHVIVNGTVLLENGRLTDALPGQIIRSPLYQAGAAEFTPAGTLAPP
jgi:hypothetical protein